MPTVLIVDYDEDYALIIKALLEFLDVEITISTETSEAYDLIRKAKPNLIILELNMPKTTGLQLMNILKNDSDGLGLGKIPVLVLTESDSEEDLQYARSIGAKDCLKKPSTDQEITTLIRKILNKPVPVTPEREPAAYEPEAPKYKKEIQEIKVFAMSRDSDFLAAFKAFDWVKMSAFSSCFLLHSQIKNYGFPKLVFLDLDCQNYPVYDLLSRLEAHQSYKSKNIYILYSADQHTHLRRVLHHHHIELVQKPADPGWLERLVTQHSEHVVKESTPKPTESEENDEDEKARELEEARQEEETQKTSAALANIEPDSFVREVLRGIRDPKVAPLEQELANYHHSTNEDIKWNSRSSLSVLFWHLYTAVVGNLALMEASHPKRMFIRFGLLDKRLLSKPNSEAFFQHADIQAGNPEIPVYYTDEWLKAIQKNKINLSETKLSGSALMDKEEPGGDLDKALAKELHVCRMMIKILIGRFGNPFPILEDSRIRNLQTCVLWRKQVQDIVARVDRFLDPGAFDRTVNGVRNHVIPYFLILPVSGSKGMSWQPWEIRDRINSRGRIMLPLLSIQDAEEIVIKAIADYRWEIETSTTLRYWETDGIINAYYTLYRKKTRFDIKSQFIKDYYIWLTRESQGRAILSKETREVLWRHVPFSSEIRSKLFQSQTYKNLTAKKSQQAKSED